MTFALFYASKTFMRIIEVGMSSEQDLREWFVRCREWKDVVRVRIVRDGEVLADETLEHRIRDPENPEREEQSRELAERMDLTFVGDRRYVKRTSEAAPPSKLTVDPNAQQVCWCGHARIQHAGADSTGQCKAECATRCNRFRAKR